MKLTGDNFTQFSLDCYFNPQCFSIKEFESDLLRFQHINKLFLRYVESGDLNVRLILNHIIILYNIFGNNTTEMLFYKIHEEYKEGLITFLIYLDRLPQPYDGTLDQTIINTLRNL